MQTINLYPDQLIHRLIQAATSLAGIQMTPLSDDGEVFRDDMNDLFLHVSQIENGVLMDCYHWHTRIRYGYEDSESLIRKKQKLDALMTVIFRDHNTAEGSLPFGNYHLDP